MSTNQSDAVVFTNTDMAGADLSVRKVDWDYACFRFTGQEHNLTRAGMGDLCLWLVKHGAYLDTEQKEVLKGLLSVVV